MEAVLGTTIYKHYTILILYIDLLLTKITIDLTISRNVIF